MAECAKGIDDSDEGQVIVNEFSSIIFVLSLHIHPQTVSKDKKFITWTELNVILSPFLWSVNFNLVPFVQRNFPIFRLVFCTRSLLCYEFFFEYIAFVSGYFSVFGLGWEMANSDRSFTLRQTVFEAVLPKWPTKKKVDVREGWTWVEQNGWERAKPTLILSDV